MSENMLFAPLIFSKRSVTTLDFKRKYKQKDPETKGIFTYLNVQMFHIPKECS